MSREKIRRAKRKSPKFKPFKDPTLKWEEKLEMKKLRKKKKQKRAIFEIED